jgi:hypothetical protein
LIKVFFFFLTIFGCYLFSKISLLIVDIPVANPIFVAAATVSNESIDIAETVSEDDNDLSVHVEKITTETMEIDLDVDKEVCIFLNE